MADDQPTLTEEEVARLTAEFNRLQRAAEAFPIDVLDRAAQIRPDQLVPEFTEWFKTTFSSSLENGMDVSSAELISALREDFPKEWIDVVPQDATTQDIKYAIDEQTRAENFFLRYGQPYTQENAELFLVASKVKGWLGTSNGRPLTLENYLQREIEDRQYLENMRQAEDERKKTLLDTPCTPEQLAENAEKIERWQQAQETFPPESLDRANQMSERLPIPDFEGWFHQRYHGSIPEMSNSVPWQEALRALQQDFPDQAFDVQWNSDEGDNRARLDEIREQAGKVINDTNFEHLYGMPATEENHELVYDAWDARRWEKHHEGSLTLSNYLVDKCKMPDTSGPEGGPLRMGMGTTSTPRDHAGPDTKCKMDWMHTGEDADMTIVFHEERDCPRGTTKVEEEHSSEQNIANLPNNKPTKKDKGNSR